MLTWLRIQKYRNSELSKLIIDYLLGKKSLLQSTCFHQRSACLENDAKFDLGNAGFLYQHGFSPEPWNKAGFQRISGKAAVSGSGSSCGESDAQGTASSFPCSRGGMNGFPFLFLTIQIYSKQLGLVLL